MAITKRYINLAMSDSDAVSWLQAYLQTALVDTLGIAGSVAIDELDDTKLIISGSGITVTLTKGTTNIGGITSKCLNDNSTKTLSYNDETTKIKYVMTTSTSALLLFTDSTGRYHVPIIFAKTNNGKMAMIASDARVDTGSTSIFPGGSKYYIFSGDDNTVQTTQRTYTVDKSQATLTQVQIVPFITNPPIGTASYTVGAYTATLSNIVCDSYGGWEDYILGDHHYLTNGGWWLKDDPV